MRRKSDIVVVGAGAFGCWSALFLQKSGFKTTLVDAWAVAHGRASSGGENRIIRASYGPRAIYTDWAWSALNEWRAHEQQWKRALFVTSKVLWLGRADDPEMLASRRVLSERQIPFEEIPPAALATRFPILSPDAVESAYLETEAGLLLARKACRDIARLFILAGGHFEIAKVVPPASTGSRLAQIDLLDGGTLEADQFVFSCGAWLPELFPDLLARRLTPTRQEVFFFGLPAGSRQGSPEALPAWIDYTQAEPFYGLPAVEGRGIKVASDKHGPPLNPTTDNRLPTESELKRVRDYLALRLPVMRDAPLLESRVCQYELTTDTHLIVDRHPQLANVIIAGGGSGHGFKLSPVVGRQVVKLVQRQGMAPAEVRLSRFSGSA